VIFALAAALSWGLADFLGAVSTRRVGLLLTMCTGQVVTLVVLGFVAATLRSDNVHLSWGELAALVLSGILGAASYAGFYRALQLGPVSLVSPVFSAYAAITVLLAVVVGQESLAAAALAGIAATLGGVILASAAGRPPPAPGQVEPASGRPAPASGQVEAVPGRPAPAPGPVEAAPGPGGPAQRPGPAPRPHTSGIPYALAAMVAWGVTTYILGRSAQRLGWFLPVAASRAVTLVILLAAAAAAALRHRLGRPRPRDLALPAIAGLFDVLAFLAYTRGSQGGSVSVTAAASACFPLVVIAGGVLVFRERLRRIQIVGIGLTIAGLLVLGLAR
jgi:drug/metabolite transporter (DMT)-like permease